MKIVKQHIIQTVLVIASLSISLSTSAELNNINLFSYVDHPSRASNSGIRQNTPEQPIILNPSLASVNSGQSIVISLAQEQDLALIVNKNKVLSNGDRLVKANDQTGNELLITIGQRASFGMLRGKDLNYHIGYKPGTGAYILNQKSFPSPTIDLGEDGRIPNDIDPKNYVTPSLNLAKKHQQVRNKDGDSIITLLAIYTPEFASGFGAPETRINQAIEFTNSALTRSGIDIQFQLVHAELVNFDNNGDNGALLTSVTRGEDSFVNVPALRDTHGADMVTVLRFQNSNSSSGIAWINGNRENLAYSIVQLSPNCCDSVFAHELGHNLGSGHERDSANPGVANTCDFNFTGYSCGHGNQSAGWGTVMSRLNSSAVNNVFSNPNLNCLGAPCGIPEGQVDQADNTQSFNISGPLIAAFRGDPVPVPTPTPIAPPNPNGDIPIPAILPLLLDEEALNKTSN